MITMSFYEFAIQDMLCTAATSSTYAWYLDVAGRHLQGVMLPMAVTTKQLSCPNIHT